MHSIFVHFNYNNSINEIPLYISKKTEIYIANMCIPCYHNITFYNLGGIYMPKKVHFNIDGIDYSHKLDEHPDPDESFMHAHDGYEVLCFVSGSGSYLVESTTYPLHPGCVLLMRPGEVHKLEIDPNTPYERVIIQFDDRTIAANSYLHETLLDPFNDRPLGTGNQFTPEEYDSRFVMQYCRRIEHVGAEIDGSVYVRTALPAILAEFHYSFHHRRRQAEDSNNRSLIQEIIAYVNRHLYDDLSLEKLCAKFYISKTQLGRLFRHATGSTTWDYILVKRLIEARRMILSGIPATQAAASCGFRDYSAFYRAYKKRYASSPAAEREQLLKPQ